MPFKHSNYSINAAIEEIKPGRWFMDGHNRLFMKIQDVLPSGLPACLLRVDGKNGRLIGDLNVNAIDADGIPGCCPYGMKIFRVANQSDLRESTENIPTIRHIPIGG